MSDVNRALAQIAEIHEQLGRATVFRGWRPIPVASSGLAGLVAAGWQAAESRSLEPWHFVAYWMAVGTVAVAIGFAEIAWHYVARADEVDRGRARHAVGQFLPALLAGALVTGAFIRLSPSLVVLLPGLWALFFGVGVFATRPFTVRGSHWVALYYWTAGLVLLWNAHDLSALSPWSVGGTFGAGQILAAGVLYVNLERPAQKLQRKNDDDTQA